MTASLIDTNILVYANNKDSEFHDVCKSVVEKAVNGETKAVIAIQNLIELYAVITDRRRIEHPLSSVKAKELIEPKSQSIFDYLLVATMLDNGIHRIHTTNSEHFEHFDSITIINPFAP